MDLEGEPLIEVVDNLTYYGTLEETGDVQFFHLIQRGKILTACLEEFSENFVDKISPEKQVILAFEARNVDTNVALVKDLIFKSQIFRNFLMALEKPNVQVVTVDTDNKFGSAAMHIFASVIARLYKEIKSPVRVGDLSIAKNLALNLNNN
jgi:hypothetical protein